MKAGDLICYNAGGMKYKTLGLVIQLGDRREKFSNRYNSVLIQWCIIGPYMPRREWRNQEWPSMEPMQPGQLAWHEIGDWLEVVK